MGWDSEEAKVALKNEKEGDVSEKRWQYTLLTLLYVIPASGHRASQI